jgi:hypothetical protein
MAKGAWRMVHGAWRMEHGTRSIWEGIRKQRAGRREQGAGSSVQGTGSVITCAARGRMYMFMVEGLTRNLNSTYQHMVHRVRKKCRRACGCCMLTERNGGERACAAAICKAGGRLRMGRLRQVADDATTRHAAPQPDAASSPFAAVLVLTPLAGKVAHQRKVLQRGRV